MYIHNILCVCVRFINIDSIRFVKFNFPVFFCPTPSNILPFVRAPLVERVVNLIDVQASDELIVKNKLVKTGVFFFYIIKT